MEPIKIEITISRIGYQVDYYRGDSHSMKARDFGISKDPAKIGGLLSTVILAQLDFLRSGADLKEVT